MKKNVSFFRNGVEFARNNPQILYTLFLVIVIPLAFFFTSEQFLKITRQNQDLLERSRIGLLQDSFAIFASGSLSKAPQLESQIREIAKNNETMVTFSILGTQNERGYPILASLGDHDVDEVLNITDPLSQGLFDATSGNKEHASYAGELYVGGVRYWRSVRAITDPQGGEITGYVLIDMSMGLADAISRKNIQNAYFTLIFIILLIIILLARQARIIDYASLYNRLKEVDTMKDDFVSMAAHELRSPLTIIRGYTEMISDEDHLSEQVRAHLANIDHSAIQLNTLIGDILDVAKLQEGRMSFNFTAVDVDTEINAVIESFRRPALDKGLQLLYERKTLPKISVDIDRLRQILVNCIGNAIKYTPTGSVAVLISNVNDRVIIRISDTGMGISAEDQKKLFQKFFRVKNDDTKKITGTGLGLWITQEIVKSMHGTITVESIQGKGTDFILSFPIA